MAIVRAQTFSPRRFLFSEKYARELFIAAHYILAFSPIILAEFTQEHTNAFWPWLLAFGVIALTLISILTWRSPTGWDVRPLYARKFGSLFGTKSKGADKGDRDAP